MNKGGQFYIVAAVIIVLALATLTGVKTYTLTKSKPASIKDISEMLNLEGSKVVDYGIYNFDENTNITSAINKFITEVVEPYFEEKTSGTGEVVIVYRDDGGDIQARVIKKESPGGIDTPLGSQDFQKTITQTLDNPCRDLSGEDCSINLFDQEYDFSLKTNDILSFMLGEETGGERYIEEKRGRERNE